jgi:hypothetical protein
MSSEANLQSAEIVRGTDKVLVVSVTNRLGTIVDLTGAEAEYKVARKLRSKAAPVLSKTSNPAAGIVITDAAGGILEITIDASDTTDLGGEYYHEAYITDVAGKRARIFEGELTVLDALG